MPARRTDGIILASANIEENCKWIFFCCNDAWLGRRATDLCRFSMTAFGYGKAVLLLWFVPSRVTFVTVGFVFFGLPHVKDDVSAEEHITLASSVRLSYEWLLTPVCQLHNQHLIHHLFPTMLSYRRLRAWCLLEPELVQRNLQVQHGLALWPVEHHS